MSPAEVTDITKRAKQDAEGIKAGWSYRGCPYHRQDEVDLYTEVFQAAMKGPR